MDRNPVRLARSPLSSLVSAGIYFPWVLLFWLISACFCKAAALWREQDRLLHLWHGKTCPDISGQCTVIPHCRGMKDLLKHMGECDDERCEVSIAFHGNSAHDCTRNVALTPHSLPFTRGVFCKAIHHSTCTRVKDVDRLLLCRHPIFPSSRFEYLLKPLLDAHGPMALGFVRYLLCLFAMAALHIDHLPFRRCCAVRHRSLLCLRVPRPCIMCLYRIATVWSRGRRCDTTVPARTSSAAFAGRCGRRSRR